MNSECKYFAKLYGGGETGVLARALPFIGANVQITCTYNTAPRVPCPGSSIYGTYVIKVHAKINRNYNLFTGTYDGTINYVPPIYLQIRNCVIR